MHLSKHTECTIPRVNPKVNYGLWIIMTCQCWFILGERWTTLLSGIDNGEAMHVWVPGVHVNLCHPLNSTVNLKPC